MMYLNNRQTTLLLTPFVIAALTYYFADTIVENMKYLFPTYSAYQGEDLNNKAAIYLAIDSKKEIYMKLRKKMKKRDENQWIVDDLLYVKTPHKESNASVLKSTQTTLAPQVLKLQMSFPKKNIAIINNTILKLHATIQDAKLITIEEKRVLLQHKGREEWLYMFQ